MDIIDWLATGPEHYRGTGTNHEGETFTGQLQVQPLLERKAVMLHYSASLASGERVHAECTLLALNAQGSPTLWPVMSELPGVLPHECVDLTDTGCTFASAAREDRSRFREEISVQWLADGSLTYAHAWGLPDGDFRERSSCRMVGRGA